MSEASAQRPSQPEMDRQIRQAFGLLYRDPARARTVAQTALGSASGLGYSDGVVRSSSALMAVHAQYGEYQAALALATPALEAQLAQASEETQASYWNALGVIHRQLGSGRQAVACFARVLALEINPETNSASRERRAALRNNIGDVLLGLEAYREAQRFFEAAAEIWDDPSKSTPRYFTSVIGRAAALGQLGQPDQALDLLEAALASDALKAYPLLWAEVVAGAARLHRWAGRHGQATALWARLAPQQETLPDGVRGLQQLETGLIAAAQGRPRDAVAALYSALDLGSAAGQLHEVQQAHAALAALYTQAGDEPAALHHQKAARALEIASFAGAPAAWAEASEKLMGAWATPPAPLAQRWPPADLAALAPHGLAPQDRPTGLLAPAELRAHLQHQLAEAARLGAGVAVIHIDVDHFRPLRERFGAVVAEAVMAELADRMMRQWPAHRLGRIGPDALSLVLWSAEPCGDVVSALRHTLGDLARPLLESVPGLSVTASAGIAAYPLDGASAEGLLHQADLALLAAKRAGRNTVRRAGQPEQPPSQGAAPTAAPDSNLSERELEVLRLMVLGHSNKAIGQQLGISPYTARHHVTSILAKTATKSRTEAVATALRRGWLNPP